MSKSNGKAKSKAQSSAFDAMSGSTDAAQKMFAQASSFGGDLGEINRANMEAMTQSAQAAGKGLQTLGQTAVSFMKETAERNMKVAQEMGGVKTVQDFTSLQNEYTKTSVQTYIDQMTQMGKMFATTMREAAEPLTVQAGAVAQKFQQNA